jgi:SH3-like domain-containing protein
VSKKNAPILALFAFVVMTLTQFPGVTTPPLLAAQSNEQTIGASGLTLPRWVALHSEKVHMRTGPGTHYPIDWVYHRQSLPMEVLDEHGPWRKVRDFEGTTGWIHRQLLIGPRYAMVRGKTRILYSDKDLASPRIVIAEAGVTGRLLTCEDIWCRLLIQDRQGWIERRHLWGVYKDEAFD